MPFRPPQKVLERYADVLVNFALGGGMGIRPGEVVRISAHEVARPLYVELHRAVWRAGGHTIGHYLTDEDAGANLARDFYELAADEQLDFFAATYWRGLIDQVDHQVSVLSETDLHALEGVDPALIMRAGRAMKPAMDWRTEKENAGRFTWTLGLYGTRGNGGRGRSHGGGVLAADHRRVLPDGGGSDRPLARGQRPSCTTMWTASTRWRSTVCTSSEPT